MEKIEHAGLVIRIEQDQDVESPLDQDCNDGLHITYKAGSRYTLGNDAIDFEEFVSIGERIASGELIGLAVYAYIHSGTYLSTRSFKGRINSAHEGWDEGQSGWVYVNKATALEWQGGKVLTLAALLNTLKGLEAIVGEFGKWLNGECYYYSVETEDGEHLDSCGGFIGYEYAVQEAKESAEHSAKKIREDKRQEWLAALREARERRYWLNRGVVTV